MDHLAPGWLCTGPCKAEQVCVFLAFLEPEISQILSRLHYQNQAGALGHLRPLLSKAQSERASRMGVTSHTGIIIRIHAITVCAL